MATSKGSLAQMLNAFESKLDELEDSGLEASFDYPDDLEDLENGEYESHVTEPVNAGECLDEDVEGCDDVIESAASDIDIIERSTIEAAEEEPLYDEGYIQDLINEADFEIYGRHEEVDAITYDDNDEGIAITLTVDVDGDISVVDVFVPFDHLMMEDDYLSYDADVIANEVDAELLDIGVE